MLVELLKKHTVADVDFVLSAMDKSHVEKARWPWRDMLPFTLSFSNSPDHYDVAIPDPSFWAWPEKAIRSQVRNMISLPTPPGERVFFVFLPLPRPMWHVARRVRVEAGGRSVSQPWPTMRTPPPPQLWRHLHALTLYLLWRLLPALLPALPVLLPALLPFPLLRLRAR